MLIGSLAHRVGYTLGVKAIHSEKITKNVTQIGHVHEANTLSNSSVDLDDEVDGLNNLRDHKLLNILVSY